MKIIIYLYILIINPINDLYSQLMSLNKPIMVVYSYSPTKTYNPQAQMTVVDGQGNYVNLISTNDLMPLILHYKSNDTINIDSVRIWLHK